MRQPPEKLVTGSFVCASVNPRPISRVSARAGAGVTVGVGESGVRVGFGLRHREPPMPPQSALRCAVIACRRQACSRARCGPRPAFPARRARFATTAASRNRRRPRADRRVARRRAWTCPPPLAPMSPAFSPGLSANVVCSTERFGASGKAELVKANHGVETQASTGKRYFRLARVVAAGSLTLVREVGAPLAVRSSVF